MRNDKFETRLTSGNGAGHQQLVDRRPEKQQERARNLKFAAFYLTVGVLLFLANHFAKQPRANGDEPDALSNVALDLSIGRKAEPAGTGNNPTEGTTYAIRFRLINRGNQSVFYPVYPGTNRPIGRLVHRTNPGAEWVVLSWPEEESPSAPTTVEDKVAWVEMRPGGWVDGAFNDPGSPNEDHAYELDLKVATDDKVVRFISQTYRVSAN